MALHVKKGDNVLVLAGKDKGKTGKVLSADPKNNRVVVDGVNIITKHNNPRSAQVPGGIEKTNGTIDSSNVQVICPSCNKATRIGNAEVNGKKTRVCKKCGAALDIKAKAEKKATKKTAKAAAEDTAAVEVAAEEKAVKKTTTKKTAAKKTETAEKKPATKKAEKTETAEKKTTAKKTTAKKTEESSEK